MLRVATPFPNVGSYALFIDSELPVSEQRAELARIVGSSADGNGEVLIGLPLRVGASGSRTVRIDQLKDATPLSEAEKAELQALREHLSGSPRPNRKKIERAEALRTRQIFAEKVMPYELLKLHKLQAKGQHSTGSRLPLSEVA